ncbi:ATP-dependent helicase [Elstera cyanobacteriorum]|uniref:ATP-dependent helicase n=1 Tax=Elstera cyanobacteriorum TaxID=2022747 RepID=UPI002354C797|nr:UvrD-helicase domain-containing protein [Elstera cyanobacteriorum]MCK6441919.1 UvrD-helicase domain-containing protein [Elstera cyanobacteriorum]
MNDSFADLPEPDAPDAPPAYLTGLNPPQRAAVEATEGPVLVLAGAGTGKTRVLITRLAHLIVTRRAQPWQILAVTFTNRAAREMRERVANLIGPVAQDIWLGTFHALAARLLRRHAELVGLKSSFTILDTDDQLRLLKQILQANSVDEKRWPAKLLLGTIERWKDRGLTPEKLKLDDGGELAGGRLVDLYRQYQERLKVLNTCDFGDLLLHMVTIFQQHPDVLAEYHRKFKYILVDEYQDTNVVQYLWLRLLAQQSKNICCVGDDDQSIYAWRGAEIDNILKFDKDFPDAKVIRLEQNYRSTAPILAVAGHLIAHNEGRLGKTLWTDQQGGAPVKVRGVWDGSEEAREIGDEIEALQRDGQSLGDMAILVRAGFQTREFEERLLTLGVPYRVIGGLRFYERAEVRDAVAYLRLIAQPDDDLAFERIVNTPRRGIGDVALQTLHRAARAANLSLTLAAYDVVTTDELKPAARKAVSRFLADFDRWRQLAQGLSVAELTEQVLDDSGYTAMWQADKSPEAPGRLENLKELVRAVEEFETLPAFLEHVSLVTERAEESGQAQVTLMTLHAAKGLEFDTVFLPGWEEGVFPNQRSLDETGARGLEEERRLAYVGLTRARQRAYVFHAANRRIHNQWQSLLPSRFITELPGDQIDLSAATGLAGAYRRPTVETYGGASFGGSSYGGGETNAERWAARRAAPSRGPVIEGKAARLVSGSAPKFTVGERVFHQKFGSGVVEAAEGDKLQVAFEAAGIKHVMAAFIEKMR